MLFNSLTFEGSRRQPSGRISACNPSPDLSSVQNRQWRENLSDTRTRVDFESLSGGCESLLGRSIFCPWSRLLRSRGPERTGCQSWRSCRRPTWFLSRHFCSPRWNSKSIVGIAKQLLKWIRSLRRRRRLQHHSDPWLDHKFQMLDWKKLLVFDSLFRKCFFLVFFAFFRICFVFVQRWRLLSKHSVRKWQ